MKNCGYGDLKSLIAGRSSHRKFTQESIPADIIEKLVDCARMAPSGHNLQPWKFVAVSHGGMIARIAEAVEKGLQAALDSLPADRAKKLDDYRFLVTHFKEAPLVFVVLIEESLYLTAELSRDYGVPQPP
ncbi:MAG: nitroreductase family protein, partial [Spirochaetales bacterium]|nr:nitroreductase family protein [Spirochaetales bacterium]